MPLYEYNCQRCSKTFEKLQKFSDEPLKVHDECGGELEKLISMSAFQLKGTGWYVTDYPRNGKSKDSNGTEGKSDAKNGASKAETKAEAKPESKPASKPSADK